MHPFFQKIKKIVRREGDIVANFIHTHISFLHLHSPREHWVPDVPTRDTLQQTKITTYIVTYEVCRVLKKQLFSEAVLILPGESDQSCFGKIIYEGRSIGFYLGKGYEYDAYWARFWLD